MKRLGVNIDHVATVRQLRGTPYPDIVAAAEAARRGGADQITVHLREDRRHIQDRDAEQLKTFSLPLNLEMAAASDVVAIACRLRPTQATLVPERREELTTEGGLDVVSKRASIEKAITALHAANIKVSLFVEPDETHIRAAKSMGVEGIELHTGRYAEMWEQKKGENEFQRLQTAARLACELKLHVAAGHGLHRDNLPPLVQKIPEIEEYNIGHAIVAEAIFVGLEKAVRDIKTIVEGT